MIRRNSKLPTSLKSTQGSAADQIAKLDKTYDLTRGAIASKIGASDDYCTDEQTEKIKKDLTRHLAGDFSPSARKAEANAADWWQSKSDQKPFDANDVFCRGGICY